MDTVPPPVRRLAETLSRLHGPAIVRKETNGYHIYLASPECLIRDGRKELASKHLTVNASKYYNLDDWVALGKTGKDPDFSAVCHKTETKYRVSDLMNPRLFPPLEQRGIKNVGTHITFAAFDSKDSLIQDEHGNWIPVNPGQVVSILDLPPRHPAVEYLIGRGYSLELLHAQFHCTFCLTETPEDSVKGIYYKRLPLNFRDTPQGRIIFYSFINTVQVGWQARILDRVVDGKKEYWHPYSNNWLPVEYKDPKTEKWEPLPGVEVHTDTFDILWKPSKYKTAFGMSRNTTLMGIDAAVAWNKRMQLKKPTAIVVEGPLDAGRFGPPGVAILGKYLSDTQADLLCKKFSKLIFVMDNDAAGLKARERIKEIMATRMAEVIFVDVPPQYKDIGEMPFSDAFLLIHQHLI